MNEFSDVGSVLSDIKSLQLSKAFSTPYDIGSHNNGDEENKEDEKKKNRRGTSLNVLLDVMKSHQSHLDNLGSLDFNIFDLSSQIHRE